MSTASWNGRRAATSSHPEPAVELASVSRLFGTVPALRCVSLTIKQGDTVVLRGPNGAGKTTLLHLIATVVTPTFGTGRVLGHDLLAGRREIRARTEFLGHDTRLYDELTVAENLRLTCRLYRCDPRASPSALDRVGLGGAASDPVRGFSPGMRQRAALVRLLLRSPDLLLLDEPYAAIDDTTKALVDDVLQAAQQARRTVVVSTHDCSRVGWADRVLSLHEGRIVCARTGSSDERVG
jgi:heme exporter protein A